MATKTQPPTEAEIRAMLVMAEQHGQEIDADPRPGEAPLRTDLRGVVRYYAWPFLEDALGPEPDDDDEPERYMWADLRPSEGRRLTELIDAAADRVTDRCVALIVDELTAAALAFAAEHPDAPRAKVPAEAVA